jgi:hypothetical protein
MINTLDALLIASPHLPKLSLGRQEWVVTPPCQMMQPIEQRYLDSRELVDSEVMELSASGSQC